MATWGDYYKIFDNTIVTDRTIQVNHYMFTNSNVYSEYVTRTDNATGPNLNAIFVQPDGRMNEGCKSKPLLFSFQYCSFLNFWSANADYRPYLRQVSAGLLHIEYRNAVQERADRFLIGIYKTNNFPCRLYLVNILN